ncbi:MAG TPA: hypothetical protein VGC99_01980, partial [Candidatus Tectomicrobia bacterium]
MRAIGEDFADSIGQHCSRTHFNEDARSRLIQRLDLWKELDRAYQVFNQQTGHGSWSFGIRLRSSVGEDREASRTQLYRGEKLPQRLLRWHHQRRVEGASDGDLPGSFALGAE